MNSNNYQRETQSIDVPICRSPAEEHHQHRQHRQLKNRVHGVTGTRQDVGYGTMESDSGAPGYVRPYNVPVGVQNLRQVRSSQVDPQHQVNLLHGRVQSPRQTDGARVVHQDVDSC